jgi:hypothetical protein
MAPPTPAKLVAAVVAFADEHFYSSVLWNIALDAGEQSGRRQAAIQEEAPSDNGRRGCLQRLAQVSDRRSRTGLAIKLWIQYLRGRCLTCGSTPRTTAMALGGRRRFCEGLLRYRSELAELGESCDARRSAPGPSTYDPLHHYALARERLLRLISRLVTTRQTPGHRCTQRSTRCFACVFAAASWPLRQALDRWTPGARSASDAKGKFVVVTHDPS